MARSGVEREKRAMSRPTSMLLRTLAVAGFAGVAWLLSGGTAHAAADHRATGPDDPSVVNVVADLGGALGASTTGSDGESLLAPVTHVLDTATAPVRDHGTTPAAPARQGTAAGSTADTATDQVGSDPDNGPRYTAGDGALTGLVQVLADPLGTAGPAAGRTTGGPLHGVLNPLTATVLDPLGLGQVGLGQLGRVLSPVTQVLTPLSGVLRPVTSLVTAGTGGLLTTVGRVTAPAGHAAPVSSAPAGDRRSTAGPGPEAHAPTVTDRCTGAGRGHVSSATGQPAGAESGGAGNPAAGRGSDEPERQFPFGAYPGGACGSGTGGSGFPTGGGAFALAPHPAACDSVDSHLARPASDVEVPRLVARTPTVSPD